MKGCRIVLVHGPLRTRDHRKVEMGGVVRRVVAVVLTASALAVLTSPTAWAGLSNEPTGLVGGV